MQVHKHLHCCVNKTELVLMVDRSNPLLVIKCDADQPTKDDPHGQIAVAANGCNPIFQMMQIKVNQSKMGNQLKKLHAIFNIS